MKATGWAKGLQVTADGTGIVSHAGVALVRALADNIGLTAGLSKALATDRLLVHDRGRVLAGLACAIADGAEVISDFRVIGDQDELFGLVASVPTAWRTLAEIARDGRAPGRITAAVNAARRRASRPGTAPFPASRSRTRRWPGRRASGWTPAWWPVTEKEQATPTWKKTFGHHPMTAWADHGADGNEEPLALVLRPGNAGSNTAADHIEAARLAVAQLPRRLRRNVLVRADSGGGTHEFLKWLTAKSRRLHYSLGMVITEAIAEAIGTVPADAWTPAYDGGGQVRKGAWVAGISGLLDLDSWPAGMRVIVRKERPHPGAQLRFTDIDGHRFTAFATDTKKGQLADLELRHRRRARCEDRILLSGSSGCRALWRLSTLEELLQQVSRDVVLVIVADQKPGQRGTGLMCDTCRGGGG